MFDLGTIAAIGGVLLAAVLVWAIIANRRRSNADRRRTQDGTRNLYREIDREDQATDPDKNEY